MFLKLHKTIKMEYLTDEAMQYYIIFWHIAES